MSFNNTYVGENQHVPFQMNSAFQTPSTSAFQTPSTSAFQTPSTSAFQTPTHSPQLKTAIKSNVDPNFDYNFSIRRSASSSTSSAPTTPDVSAKIARRHQLTLDTVITQEWEPWLSIYKRAMTTQHNEVTRNPDDTQYLLPLTWQDALKLHAKNYDNAINDRAINTSNVSTEIAPMLSNLNEIARRVNILNIAGINIKIGVVQWAFQYLNTDGSKQANDHGGRLQHSHQQTRFEPLAPWWRPRGYVWAYGSHKHAAGTVNQIHLELDQVQHAYNKRGQVNILRFSEGRSAAFIIWEFDPESLLQCITQVPAASSSFTDQLKRDAFSDAVNQSTLHQLDSMRPHQDLVRAIMTSAHLSNDQLIMMAHLKIFDKWRATHFEGPPRTLPAGVFSIEHSSSTPIDVQLLEHYNSAATIIVPMPTTAPAHHARATAMYK